MGITVNDETWADLGRPMYSMYEYVTRIGD